MLLSETEVFSPTLSSERQCSRFWLFIGWVFPHHMEGLNSLAGRAYYCEFWGNISWGELWILTTMSKPKEWDKMTVWAWWEHPLPWMSGGCCGKKNGSFLLKCTGASLFHRLYTSYRCLETLCACSGQLQEILSSEKIFFFFRKYSFRENCWNWC